MKLYDFALDVQMSPGIGLLHSMVSYNFQRLKRLVEGLSQEKIDFKGPNHDMNSISQLLRHLAVVDLHWVYRLRSLEIPPEVKARFGPMYDEYGKLPSVSGISLQTLLEEYDEVQEMFRNVCTTFTDDDLLRVVPFENGHQSTVRWGIWHVADHSRHHYSNIAFLKKLLRSQHGRI